MIDSEEDPESQKTMRKDETSRSTYLRVGDSGVDPELHSILGASSTDSLTENTTWWTSVVISTERSTGSIQDGGIHVPARLVILKEDDSTGTSSASVITTEDTKTITPEEKKKKNDVGNHRKSSPGINERRDAGRNKAKELFTNTCLTGTNEFQHISGSKYTSMIK